jgi:hypothetical protein
VQPLIGPSSMGEPRVDPITITFPWWSLALVLHRYCIHDVCRGRSFDVPGLFLGALIGAPSPRPPLSGALIGAPSPGPLSLGGLYPAAYPPGGVPSPGMMCM